MCIHTYVSICEQLHILLTVSIVCEIQSKFKWKLHLEFRTHTPTIVSRYLWGPLNYLRLIRIAPPLMCEHAIKCGHNLGLKLFRPTSIGRGTNDRTTNTFSWAHEIFKGVCGHTTTSISKILIQLKIIFFTVDF